MNKLIGKLNPITELKLLQAEIYQIGQQEEARRWLSSEEGQDWLTGMDSTLRAIDPGYRQWVEMQTFPQRDDDHNYGWGYGEGDD